MIKISQYPTFADMLFSHHSRMLNRSMVRAYYEGRDMVQVCVRFYAAEKWN